jgi:hypothetical protein
MKEYVVTANGKEKLVTTLYYRVTKTVARLHKRGIKSVYVTERERKMGRES